LQRPDQFLALFAPQIDQLLDFRLQRAHCRVAFVALGRNPSAIRLGLVKSLLQGVVCGLPEHRRVLRARGFDGAVQLARQQLERFAECDLRIAKVRSGL
jgi:hypothetical protein